VNLTCLIPSERTSFPEPKRCDLREIIRAWLDFRYETVRRRFEYELEKLKERIHILEGFAIVFDALDEAIRIIRGSQGKRDASEQLMVRFTLDDVQADAILELRLYKLAQLEILAIREELEEKLAMAARIEAILASSEELWSNVREELLELRKLYGEKRRTQIGGVEESPVLSYSEDDYIVAEDAFVIVTRDGWIKRQGRFTELEKIRIRDGDQIGWIARASTRSTLSILTDRGVSYSLRIDDVPSTTGYGEPVQRQFNFSDGERVIGVIAHDPKALPEIDPAIIAAADEENPPPPHGLALTRKGRTIRFPLTAHSSPSNKNGRRFMRPDGDDDGVLAAYVSDGTETLSIASVQGRAICFPAEEVKIIRSSGKGVTGIKLRPGDQVLAFELTREKFKGASVTTSTGREEVVRPSKFAGKRGGRGRVVLKRGSFVSWEQPVTRYDLSLAAVDADAEQTESEQQELLLNHSEGES
jgi:DNA gyrase subunit A